MFQHALYGASCFSNIRVFDKDLASNMPYMYTDQQERIDFIADSGIIDQIVEWFGTDARIMKTDDENKVKVSIKAKEPLI